jgi:hypothetical protein
MIIEDETPKIIRVQRLVTMLESSVIVPQPWQKEK